MNRMRALVLLGVVLLVLGIVSLAYGTFALEGTRKRTVGPFAVAMPKRSEVRVPRAVSWTLLAAGAFSLGLGLLRPGGK